MVKTLTQTTAEITTETTVNNIEGVKPPPTHSPVDEVFKGIYAFYGYPECTDKDPIPNYGKEGNAIKRMIARGFTVPDILECWIKKVQAAGQYKSMVYVNEDIGKAPAGNRRGNNTDPDKYLRQKYGQLVRR